MLEVKTHQSTSEHLRSSAEVPSPERKALFTLRFLHYGYASALLVERILLAANSSLGDYSPLTARQFHP